MRPRWTRRRPPRRSRPTSRATPAVRSASAWLTGPREAALFLIVTTDAEADAGAIRARITEHAVPRLRQALEVDALPVRLEVRLTAKSGARAR